MGVFTVSVSHSFKPWLLSGATLSLLCLPAIAAAQAVDLTKPPQDMLAATSGAETELAGEKLGPFTVNGGVTAAETYSDNVFVTKNNLRGDAITTIAPWASRSEERRGGEDCRNRWWAVQ